MTNLEGVKNSMTAKFRRWEKEIKHFSILSVLVLSARRIEILIRLCQWLFFKYRGKTIVCTIFKPIGGEEHSKKNRI